MKPAIYIVSHMDSADIVREISAGLEEEGVLFLLLPPGVPSDLPELVWEAAQNSPLGCGVGVFGNTAAFQIKGMKKGKYMFQSDGMPEQSRLLGANAARAVKRKPLVFDMDESKDP